MSLRILPRIGVVIIDFICAAFYVTGWVIVIFYFRLIHRIGIPFEAFLAILELHSTQTLFLVRKLIRILLRLRTRPLIINLSGRMTQTRFLLINFIMTIERHVLLDGVQKHKAVLRRQIFKDRVRRATELLLGFVWGLVVAPNDTSLRLVQAHKRRKERPILVGLPNRVGKLLASATLDVSLRHETEHRASGVFVQAGLEVIDLIWLVLLLDVKVIGRLILTQELAVEEHVASLGFKSLWLVHACRGNLAWSHGHLEGVALWVNGAGYCLVGSARFCFGMVLREAHFLVHAIRKVSRVGPSHTLVPGFDLLRRFLQRLGLELLLTADFFVAHLALGSRVFHYALETLPFGRMALDVLSGHVFMRTLSQFYIPARV